MDEAVDEGSACGFVNLVFAGVESAVCDVVADRAAEEPGVLQNHADVLAQVGAAHLRDVDVVESDSAGVDFVEAHEQVYQGGLAGTGGPDDGDHLPGPGREVHVLDQRLVRLVPERDVLELDVTDVAMTSGGLGEKRHVDVGRLLGFVEKLEDPLRRRGSGLQARRHGRDLRQWLAELARIDDEG